MKAHKKSFKKAFETPQKYFILESIDEVINLVSKQYHEMLRVFHKHEYNRKRGKPSPDSYLFNSVCASLWIKSANKVVS